MANTQWGVTLNSAQIQFTPSLNDHGPLFTLLNELHPNYPQAQQSQAAATVTVQTDKGPQMQQGQVPQWTLAHKGGKHVIQLTPLTVMIEEVTPNSNLNQITTDLGPVWQSTTTCLKPQDVNRVTMHQVCSVPVAGSRPKQWMKQCSFLPACLFEEGMRGTARVEFFPKKDMRVVLSIGPNSQDWLLCDIDVSMVGTLPTNWKDLSKSITTVSKECDTILAACLKR